MTLQEMQIHAEREDLRIKSMEMVDYIRVSISTRACVKREFVLVLDISQL